MRQIGRNRLMWMDRQIGNEQIWLDGWKVSRRWREREIGTIGEQILLGYNESDKNRLTQIQNNRDRQMDLEREGEDNEKRRKGKAGSNGVCALQTEKVIGMLCWL